SVEELYAHLDDLPEKQRALLEPYGEQVTLSKRLATIVCDLDVPLDLSAAQLEDFDSGAVRTQLHELGFRSLVDRLPSALTAGKSGDGQLAMFGQDSTATADPRDEQPSREQAAQLIVTPAAADELAR